MAYPRVTNLIVEACVGVSSRSMGPFTFDPEKATEALLYVATNIGGDMYTTLKALYVADKLHLHRYGRFVYGDEHCALPYGPVPQGAYDLVKYVRGVTDRSVYEYPPARQAFALAGNEIRPLRAPDTSVFSDSDEECLDEAIRTLRGSDFGSVKAATHDAAYNATNHCHRIAPAAIASMSEHSTALIQYLADPAPDVK
jgi:hypothetical protein